MQDKHFSSLGLAKIVIAPLDIWPRNRFEDTVRIFFLLTKVLFAISFGRSAYRGMLYTGGTLSTNWI